MPPMTEQERLLSSNAAIQGTMLLDKSNVPSIAPRGNPECRVKRRGIAGEDGPGPLRGLILNRSELLKKNGGKGEKTSLASCASCARAATREQKAQEAEVRSPSHCDNRWRTKAPKIETKK